MAINKVIYNNETLIDLTAVTVGANNLQQGVTAHDRSGSAIVGTYVTIKPQIIVVTGDGNYLTCSKSGETTLYGIATDGAYAFEVPSYGVWTITATAPNSSLNESTTVNVTSIKQYTVVLNIATTFALADWVDIATYAHNGKAQEIWEVGDTKTVTLTGGETATLEIVDMSNNQLVLDLKDIITSRAASDSSGQNPASTWVMNTFKPSLPSGLQSIIDSISWAFSRSDIESGYSLFSTTSGRAKSDSWWLANSLSLGSGVPEYVRNQYYITASGDMNMQYSTYIAGVNPKIII